MAKKEKAKKVKKDKSQDSSPKKSLWVRIRQWFQPYYNPKPDELKEPKKSKKSKKSKKEEEKSKKTEIPVITKNEGKVEKVEKIEAIVKKKKRHGSSQKEDVEPAKEEKYNQSLNAQSKMKVLAYPKPLDKAPSFNKKPKVDSIWYYHDANRHQIFFHVEPLSGYRFTSEQRDDDKRKTLVPMLYPRDRQYHRTHLIPFGYCGVENDPRLVVGWDGKQNSNELSDFEQKAKKVDEPIYWLTSIIKTENGATWTYQIYSVNDGRLIDSLTTRLDNVPFKWDR